MADPYTIGEIHKANKRIDYLEQKHEIMAALWDGQVKVLLERITRLEEQCQTNTETPPNSKSSPNKGNSKPSNSVD